MHHHIVADLCLRNEVEAGLSNDAAEFDTAYPHSVAVFNGNDFSRYGEAHRKPALILQCGSGRVSFVEGIRYFLDAVWCTEPV
jgi:hypothetical protein